MGLPPRIVTAAVAVVAAAGLVVVVAATRATAPPDRVDAGRPGSVRGLATGVALDLPWAAGNLVHLDARTVTMPEGWRVGWCAPRVGSWSMP